MAIENLDFRINAIVDASNSSTTLGELKKNLTELRNLSVEVGSDNTEAFNKVTLAAGNVNDKIKDIRETTAALSGTPVERLTNSFGRLRQSIFELDLDKFKSSLAGIKDSFVALGGQALSPFKNLGVAMSGLITGTTTLTGAMKALGGAIAATGIGALVVSFGLLIAYWDELKTSGGIIGGIFTTVSDTISAATNSLKDFLKWLGLIGQQQANNSEQAKKDAENLKKYTGDRLKVLEDAYNKEKKLRESVRKPGDDEKFKREDLQREKKYQEDRIKILEESNRSIFSIGEAFKISKENLAKEESQLRQAQEALAAKQKEEEFRMKPDVIGVELLIEDVKRAQSEYNLELERNLTLLAEIKAKSPYLGESRKEIEDTKLEVELLNNELKKLSGSKEEPKKPIVKKKGEAGFSELDFLEKYFETEEKFLDKSADIQEKYNIESSDVDKMFNEIAMEGEIQKSELIFAEIDRRLQYKKDTAEKAAEIDAQGADELEAWAIKSMQDSENLKQKKIDDANEYIKTAQMGLQALDGLDQLITNLQFNRAKGNEKMELEAQKRAFNRGKALGIVQAAINTALGITAVIASPTNKADLTGTLMATQIALVSAVGAAQIAAISSQKWNPNSSNVDNPGNTSIPSLSSNNTVSNGQFYNVGDFKPGEDVEKRVYVVESDITGTQKKVQVIENRSTY